jgi:hypothetical protein
MLSTHPATTQNAYSTFSTVEARDSSGARMNAGNAVVDQSDRAGPMR